MAHMPLSAYQDIERILSSDAVAAAYQLETGKSVAVALHTVRQALEDVVTPSVRLVARDTYQTDECEIDDDAGTSPTDEGTWVQAWVWVTWPECGTCHGGGRDELDQPCSECGGTGKGTIG